MCNQNWKDDLMKYFICILTVLFITTSLFGYEEEFTLNLDIDEIEMLRINAGPGELTVEGRDDIDRIEVNGMIRVESATKKQLRKVLNNDIDIDLRKVNEKTALLIGETRESLRGILGNRPGVAIDMHVLVPKRFTLEVSDGSGNLTIRDMMAWIRLSDGSGNLEISNVAGDLFLDDSSGDIDLQEIQGNVELDDSSGDIGVNDIAGNMRINDSSGGIVLETISGDIYIDDSSGDIRIDQVTGSVRIRDSSGDIDVANVDQDLVIEEDGSGGVSAENIRGNFKNNS